MAKRRKKSPLVEKAAKQIAKKHGISANHARAMIEVAAKAQLAAAKRAAMQRMLQQRAMQQRAMQQQAMQRQQQMQQQRPPMPQPGMPQRPPMPGGM